MADLATEIANLNAQAAELLAKYNGAFEKLDEETQNKILELQDKATELQAQIESLGFKFDENGILVKNDGSELSVGNALKLGGKSLEEVYKLKQFIMSNDVDVSIDVDSTWVEIADELNLIFTVLSENPRLEIGFIPNVEIDGTDQHRFFVRAKIIKNGEEYATTKIQYLLDAGSTGDEMGTGTITWFETIEASAGDEIKIVFETVSETDGDSVLEFGQNFVGETVCRAFVKEYSNE